MLGNPMVSKIYVLGVCWQSSDGESIALGGMEFDPWSGRFRYVEAPLRRY